ncbi:SGNH/GDSL hydrolase family protein [Leifsonia sp. C5G2]|uniref:SGNH/GDSL hydrolase family protein n=1 Tax=Leifsonia sp. C5G2 TaxID=2735269 RepID=UPI001584B78F|nr:SGNH/GDSL hydrolase family protein [Leifsonia sp. C5G2]NUU07804.1 SGNH/GDSL hydrolase family protein [Leifsonia sp. C5G2]
MQRTRTAGTGRGMRLAVVGAVAAIAIGMLTGTPAAAAPNGYLALGDSYASGQGVDGTKGDDPTCLQSPAGYPAQVAQSLGLTLTDNTCSGAVLGDIFQTSAKGHAPQASLPADSVSLVTITIGGNDLGFASILTSCLALSASGPLTSHQPTCKDKHTVDGVDAVQAKLEREVGPVLFDTLDDLRRTYTSAKIVVVGYPTLMPDASHTPEGGCFAPLKQGASFPFVTSDLAWMNTVQRALDRKLALAAQYAGVDYVSQMATTVDNSSCSAAGEPHIAPLTLTGLSTSPQSFHPNSAGLKAIGQTVTSALSPRAAFQGIRGQLIPQAGDNDYLLQYVVPAAVSGAMPDVAATRNGQYLSNVKGGSGYYLDLSGRGSAHFRYYSQKVTVNPGDQVELKVYQNGTRQVLTPLPASFAGVTGQLVRTSGDSYQLQIWVPTNTLATTPDVSARINGKYSAHVTGGSGYYLQVTSAPGYRVYYQTVTVRPGDTVVLNVTATGAQQILSS